MKTVLDSPHVHFALKGDLLIATYKKGLQMDLGIAKEVVRLRLRFTENKTLPVLILDEGVISINKEARDYLSSEEGTRCIKAAAIVLNSAVSAMLGNFLFAMNKPGMPVKLFSGTVRAMKWLEKFDSSF